MGFGDFFQKAWNWTSTTIKNSATSVKDAAQQSWEGAKKVGTKAAEVASNVATTVYTDVIKNPINAATKGFENFSNLFSNPLVWIVGAVAAITIIPPILSRAARV